MIALDTNILARFYVEDPNDAEAARQRPLARAIILDGRTLFIPLTVILEFKWVLRAFCDFKIAEIARVMDHLLGLPNLLIEDSSRIATALRLCEQQLDFADALHLAGSPHCERFLTFDDRKFARRASRLGLKPAIVVPTPGTTDYLGNPLNA